MMAADDKTRKVAEALGRRAENAAALWLRLKGYRILAKRARTPRGEIDLVVRKGPLVIAVEVKARGDFDAALEAVNPRQQARICAAMEIWCARNGFSEHDRRFDVLSVIPGRLPRHTKDAFRPDFALTQV
jgi:putative endonuclease